MEVYANMADLKSSWGPLWILGTRHAAGLTTTEAAAISGEEKVYWTRSEGGRMRPHLRFLWASASVLWSTDPTPERLQWWKLAASAWWFSTKLDQYLMPVLEWGEDSLRDIFIAAEDRAIMAEAQCLAGTWPQIPTIGMGIQRLKTLTDHAPKELLRVRIRAGIRATFFVTIVWEQIHHMSSDIEITHG